MIITIILIITMIAYSIIVSQSYMYLIALKDVQQDLTAPAYIGLRKLLDKYFSTRFKYVIYIALAGNISLVLIHCFVSDDVLLIAAVYSLMALLADIILTTKRNIPINKMINQWSPDDYPENWSDYRSSWLRIFFYRQLANISGFIVLLTGAVLTFR